MTIIIHALEFEDKKIGSGFYQVYGFIIAPLIIGVGVAILRYFLKVRIVCIQPNYYSAYCMSSCRLGER